MPEPLSHVRHGRGAARPYIHAHADALEICKSAFNAEVLEDMGGHTELAIGDSVIVIEVGETFPGNPGPCSVYVYVPDVDTAYQRALEAGAHPLAEPTDKPYEERQAGVTDAFGNSWWVSTYTG
jgi:PhnB protein